jgi:uncharacterized protein
MRPLPKQILTFLLLMLAFSSLAYYLIKHTFADPLATAFGFPDHPRAVALFLAIPGCATLSVISRTARALGEEIGWRGFLFPRLVRQSGFPWACLINGCIWAVWHYPGLLFGLERRHATRLCVDLLHAHGVCRQLHLGWLRLKSGSLWTAAILHASHNIFIQIIFDGMTAPVGRTLCITTEFGAGLALTMGG